MITGSAAVRAISMTLCDMTLSWCQISILVSGTETRSSLSARAKPVKALECLPVKLLCEDDVSSRLARS